MTRAHSPAESFVLAPGPDGGPRYGRLTPPAGFPLGPGDVVSSLAGALAAGRAAERLGRALADRLGVRQAWPVSSGRAGLALVLAVLRRLDPGRDEVVVPAYTCYSVPSAVVRAGLRVRLVDLASRGFDLDPAALREAVGPRTAAIVAAHLLGYPLDLAPVHTAARAAGAVVIDDAAQALGARVRGRPAGAGGAVGLLSFGRGKPLSALGGGAILCDEPQLVEPIGQAVAALPGAGRTKAAVTALEAALYSPLLHPGIYWLPARLSFLKIGITEYDPDFPIARLDGFRSGLARRGLPRLEAANEARRRAAERLGQRLAGVEGIELVPAPPAGDPIFLRFPVLLASAELRDRALAELRAAGIGASRLYPAPLTAIPALAGHSPGAGRSFPNAGRLARRLLCLPTYPHAGAAALAKAAARRARIGAGSAPTGAPIAR
jgi:dTDP-4-amino-4,6-dideoxygalactose transaminase